MKLPVGIMAGQKRKKMEEELRTASLYARSLIEASLDPLVTISPEGKITDVNEATVKVTGLTREKLIGTDFSDYFTEPAKAKEGYRTVFEKGYVTDYPLTIRHTSGKSTDVLYNANVYKDDAGKVLGVFAAARDITKQKKMEKEINEAITQLASSSAELSSAASQLASGAVLTATSVSETTTTVEEVKQAAELASEKAKYVSESAQKASQLAQGGKKAVDESIEAMKNIQEQMGSIAEGIVSLSEQSTTISDITGTVTDIAEQSNLLAVNAAIEAAKAGEQGKGFAVVAQEIKSLANQSKQATSQVKSILGDIQKRINTVVMLTEQGSKASEAGVKQSAVAGESIQALVASVTEAGQAATQIAASSQQQLAGMGQVASAMENIKQASTESVNSTKQTESTARSLHDLSEKLLRIVERPKGA